jgi:serine/threonine-protein kinase
MPGPLKYDHFEVEVGTDGFPIELGAGAMAITYRARDTVLNSIVALKVIDRKVAQNPGARSRFLREARAAAQIRHPNVARVSHYGEQDGECFYVMELVEGETLEAQVRREGPMELAWALEIIEQVARALAAAEACGVVHRDIKPSNIMLECDPGGTPIVKVIDYGVAKVLAPEAQPGDFQTQAGFIGTPAFASPEQFAPSGSTKIDTRSDIYSLGVTFWYLLTGRAPFVGSTMEAIHARQTEHLPLEQLKGLHVPARCIALLKAMLAPDPNDRPRSARELLSAVHRCFMRFNAEARARRKRFALAAGGLGLVIIATAATIWFHRQAQSSAAMQRSIAILPFENLSPNGEDAYFTIGMQDEIAGDLSRLAGLKVIGTQSTRSYTPEKSRDLRVVARELGVKHLLEGSVYRDRTQIRVSLHLVNPHDMSDSWNEDYQRPVTDVFALQQEITRAVAQRLQTPVSPHEKALVDTVPTTDLQAYDLYLQAHQLNEGAVESTSAVFAVGRRAMSLLEEAIARDPKFALAYCDLASWHDEFYLQRNSGPKEELAIDHRSLAEGALEKARRLQPDSGAVHRALAEHALKINRDVDEAGAEIELARRSSPNDVQVELLAGRVARRQDRWEEALRCLERAVALEPRDVKLRLLLADTNRYMRRYQDYDRITTEAIAFTPPEQLGSLLLRRAEGPIESSGDMAPYRATLTTDVAAHRLPDDDMASAELLLAVFSHDPVAISHFLSSKHKLATYNGIDYPDAWFAALAAHMRGDDTAAKENFRTARFEFDKLDEAQPTQGVPLSISILAIIDAALGEKNKAIEEGRRACELTSFKANNFNAVIVRCNLAATYAWTGENDLAFAELDPLISRPAAHHVICQPTYGDFLLNPLWDPLRKDRRFQAIMKRLAPVASK